ncbi:MAG: hypothetical protein ACQER9_01875 [Nanobdellota archaeon]
MCDFKEIRKKFIEETREKIRVSVNEDNFITQSISTISELDLITNQMSKRFREWYELYNPELSKKIKDHYTLARKAFSEKREENTMGGELSEEDIETLKVFADRIKSLYDQKEIITDYLRKKMEHYCKNILDICGPLLGAKLIAHKGSLKQLAFMPASTIQLLGAEKALFRHIVSNAKSPKYGYILQHSEVAQAKNKGKAARQLANKISLAAKKDYFKNDKTIKT